MKNDPVGMAYERFRKTFYPERHGVGLYFWNFIGLDATPNIPRDGAPAWNDWNIFDPVVQRRITLMAGPYGDVVIKMLLKNGHKWDVEVKQTEEKGLANA